MSNSNAVCNTNEAAEVQSLVANTVRGNARLGTVSGFLLVVLGVIVFAALVGIGELYLAPCGELVHQRVLFSTYLR